MKVLVAGGAGYIGSHICVELLQANHEVIVIDDFSNSKPEVLGYIKDITGKTKDFTCLILTPPCKSHSLFPYSVLLNLKKEFRFINFTSIIITWINYQVISFLIL